jgi:hypothetical protein
MDGGEKQQGRKTTARINDAKEKKEKENNECRKSRETILNAKERY